MTVQEEPKPPVKKRVAHYMEQIKYHVPQHPILKFAEETEIIFPSNVALEPISDALLVFKNGLITSGRVYARVFCLLLQLLLIIGNNNFMHFFAK